MMNATQRGALSAIIPAIVFLLLPGCLVGDPNPYDDDTQSSSGGSTTAPASGGTTGSAATGGSRSNELPVSAGVARGDGRTPISPGNDCSLSSSQSVAVTFINDFPDESLELFWVDYTCMEKPYGSIAAGVSYTQQTFSGHPWRLRKNGELFFEYVATQEPTQMVPLP